jgi:hypothetical protein
MRAATTSGPDQQGLPRMSAARIALASFVLAAVLPPVAAAERDRAHEGAQCVSIEDASTRLECYDYAFDRPTPAGVASAPVAAGAAAAVSASPPAGASPDAVRAVDEFGLTETAKRKRDPEKAKETMPESIQRPSPAFRGAATGEVVVARAIRSGSRRSVTTSACDR